MGLINPFSLDVIASKKVGGYSHSWDQSNIPDGRRNDTAQNHYNKDYNHLLPESKDEQRRKNVQFDPQGHMFNYNDEHGKKMNGQTFSRDTYSFTQRAKDHITGGTHSEVSVHDVHKIMQNHTHVTMTADGGGRVKRTHRNTRVAFHGVVDKDNDGKPLAATVVTMPQKGHGENLNYDILTAVPRGDKSKSHEPPYDRAEAKNAAQHNGPAVHTAIGNKKA